MLGACCALMLNDALLQNVQPPIPLLASRFGHVSLRLIVCPDDRAEPEDCDRNLFDHVVLGYAARIDELEMSLFKGIAGGYDSKLLGFSFMETYRTSSLLDDRDLYSIPLNLTQAQIEQFVRELSAVHWNYRGNYRFFTRNCATLLQDALGGLLPEYNADGGLDREYLRPDRFFSALRASDLVDASWLDSPAEAEARGDFFPSSRPYFERARSLVAGAASQAGPTLEDYPQWPARQRLDALVSDPALSAELARDPQILEAQILLEEYALMRLENALERGTVEWLARADAADRLQALPGQIEGKADRAFFQQCYLMPLAALQTDLPRSGGIPDESCLAEFHDTGVDCSNVDARTRIWVLLDAWIDEGPAGAQSLRDLGREIELTLHNISLLKSLL